MSNTPIRYVGLHHIAFFRAAFESDLELHAIAGRYLETGQDLPAAKRTLKFVQTALSQAAKRQGKHGAAALLRVPRSRFREQAPAQDDAPKIPTFEQYRDEVDPDGFYRENELLDMYQDEYGALASAPASPAEERRLARNLRLLQKKIRLINDLAGQISKPPTLDDLVAGWFDPRVANKFVAAKIETLGDLILFMNHRGYRWYRAIPKLGEVTAKRIVSFLAGSELSGALTPYALTPIKEYRSAVARHGAVVPRGAIVPLEQIRVPVAELNGSQGTNRAEIRRNRLQGNDDLAAINAWLALYRNNTERAYRKEAERLLLWSIYAKQKAFSSLTTEDVGEYMRFLENPTPSHMWVADRRYDRFHPAWRPFVKSGLSDKSITYAVQVLSVMCSWLVGQRYLDSNPFDGLPKLNAAVWVPIARSLSRKQWKAVREHINGLPDDLPGARLKFLIYLAYGTGMRIHEIAKAKLADLRVYNLNGGDMTYLTILGKGKKLREVPFTEGLQQYLRTYLQLRGLDHTQLHALDPNTPLIASLEDSTAFLAVRSLGHLAKDLFGQVAQELASTDPMSAQGLQRASMHWLRHTHATHALQNNVPVKTVKENLGHASLSTTSIYTHTELADRHTEIDAFLAASMG
ncbi:tyrosine-type recombinase/integrase [Allopusillimonas ginsengisoli]|uniref:tyrosine-type recombinase/integrase n=1 Tax=Allopusillimonas ginsengisoli TaxID=453575 RepID=UPI0039C03E54